MTEIEPLLDELNGLNIRLWAEAGRLRYSAPEGALTDSLVCRLRESKADLLSLLAECSGTPAIPRVSRDRYLPLSFGQERLWFLHQLEGADAAYNIPAAVRVHGPLDIKCLERSWNEVLVRHEALRTVFPIHDGRPFQFIRPPFPFGLPVTDLSDYLQLDQLKEVERLAARDAQTAFHLAEGPLVRTSILRLAPNDHVLLTCLHHIVSDGWSMGVLLRELSTIYAAFADGKPSPLPKLRIQYADYAAYQRNPTRAHSSSLALENWKSRLAGFPPVLPLPSDHPRPAVQSFRGDAVCFEIDEGLATGIRQLSLKTGCTLFMTLLSAFGVLLCRYSGSNKISVGSPIANRRDRDLEALIGFFLNTLVLPLDLMGNPSFRELLERVRQMSLEAYAAQDVPFEQLVEFMQPERSLSHAPLFQVMFVLQNNLLEEIAATGLHFSPIQVRVPGEKFDLTLSISDSGHGLTGELGYSFDLFDRGTVERMAGHFRRLLESAVLNPQTAVSDLALMPPAETNTIIKQWNATDRQRPSHVCIHNLIEAQVERSPSAVALVFEGQTLTYGELNVRANRLARHLQSLGIGPDIRVGICVERSLEMLIGLLAILKAGGAYVPLDASYPAERLAFLIKDSSVPVILTMSRLAHRLGRGGYHVIQLDLDLPLWGALDPANLSTAISPDNLAYVIYTSGSTGLPKGVMNAHRGVCNRLLWGQETFGMSSADSIVQKTPIGFDVSVWEMFWPLMSGARLVIARPDGHRDNAYLADLVRKHHVNNIHFVAPMLGAFLEQDGVKTCVSLKRFFTSGEAVSDELRRRFFEKFDLELHNLYGPTEAAIEVSHWPCSPRSAFHSVPIGRPIANIRLYIVDARCRPVPIGVPGELLIGGIGVARGYLNRPTLTATAFIPDPFSGPPGARLYRTGDQARFLADGNIEFLGRLDQQVKVRGFRIELGEIESAIASHARVNETVVLARDDGRGGKKLVAYVIPSKKELDIQELRLFLGSKLPEHEIPSMFVLLESWPLNPNGKLDRGALPTPELETSEIRWQAPHTPNEKTLAAIWSEALSLKRVGIHDNFFQVGGDSIISTRIIAKARKAGLILTARQIFQQQTIAELAAVAAPVEAAKAVAVETGPMPPTPIQRWFFDADHAVPDHYNQAVLLDVSPDLDSDSVRRAIQILIRRHDALRLRFTPKSFDQTSLAEPFSLTVVDLSSFSAEEALERIATEANRLQTSLSIEGAQLLRAAHLRGQAGAPGHVLLVIHHLAIDGISWRILLEELGEYLNQPDAPEAPNSTPSFAQWAHVLSAYSQSEECRRDLDYWRGFQNCPFHPLPLDFPEVDAANTYGEAETVSLSLPGGAKPVQWQELLLTALSHTTSHWTGNPETWVDLESHGRADIGADLDFSNTVGWFTAIYPILLDSGDTPALVHERLQAVPRLGISYGILRNELPGFPKPEIAFNFLGRFDGAFSNASVGLSISPLNRRSHLLEISAIISQDQLRMSWTYNARLHRRGTVERLAANFQVSLEKLLTDFCDTNPIEASYPLSPSQQGMLLETLGHPGSGIHIEQSAFTFEGDLAPEVFVSAWQTVIDRHSALRTYFEWEGRQRPRQIVLKSVKPVLTVQDWRDFSADEQKQMLEAWLDEDRKTGFALDVAPLLRSALFRASDNAWHFIFTFHHIVMDGWSLPILFGELIAGSSANLTTVRPFSDYIEWLSKRDVQPAQAFWRQTLSGFVSPIPIDFADPLEIGFVPQNRPNRQSAELSLEATTALELFARTRGLTLGGIVSSAWALLLSRYSGADDVVVGETVSGRPSDLEGSADIIGQFVNTVPFRCQVIPNLTFAHWALSNQVKRADRQSFEYCSSAQIHSWSELAGNQPLYETLVVFENYPATSGVSDSSAFRLIAARAVGAQTSRGLVILAKPGQALSIDIVFDWVRFAKSQVQTVLSDFTRLLEAIAYRPEHTIRELLVEIPITLRMADRRKKERPDIPPRTILEVRLARIWEHVLGCQRIGVRDNFFELGGHSLVALQLVAKIKQELGKNVSVSAVLKAPTIEQMAYDLSEIEAAAPWAPLVDIQLGAGTGPPLFCFHPLGGNVICYAEMARSLDGQRVCGLQARGLAEGQEPVRSIEEMATLYLDAIRKIQPHGPYLLAGYSFGGFVAMEVAQELQLQGEDIGLVALLDTPHPSVVPEHMQRTDAAGLLVSLFADSLALSLDDLRVMQEEDQLRHVYRRASEAGLIPPGFALDEAKRYFEVCKANHHITYAAKIYTVRATLFRAQEESNRISSDPALGWSGFLEHGVEVRWVPGKHETMLSAPHAANLGLDMKQVIDQVSVTPDDCSSFKKI